MNVLGMLQRTPAAITSTQPAQQTTGEASKVSKALSGLRGSPLKMGLIGAGALAGVALLVGCAVPTDTSRPGECGTDFWGDGYCNPVPDRVVVPNGDGSYSEYDGDEYYR